MPRDNFESMKRLTKLTFNPLGTWKALSVSCLCALKRDATKFTVAKCPMRKASWSAWIKKTVMLVTRHRASAVSQHRSIPLSTVIVTNWDDMEQNRPTTLPTKSSGLRPRNITSYSRKPFRAPLCRFSACRTPVRPRRGVGESDTTPLLLARMCCAPSFMTRACGSRTEKSVQPHLPSHTPVGSKVVESVEARGF